MWLVVYDAAKIRVLAITTIVGHNLVLFQEREDRVQATILVLNVLYIGGTLFCRDVWRSRNERSTHQMN